MKRRNGFLPSSKGDKLAPAGEEAEQLIAQLQGSAGPFGEEAERMLEKLK